MMELIDVKRSCGGMQEARKKDGRDLFEQVAVFWGLGGVFSRIPV